MMTQTPFPSRRVLMLALALLGLMAGATSVMAARGKPDRIAPKVSLTKPGNGSATTDTTPRLAGKAGRAAGDRSTVSIRVWAGPRATGKAMRLMTARRSRGEWAVTVARALAPGTYTARAEQYDARGNRGRSAASTFTLSRPPQSAKPPVVVTPPSKPSVPVVVTPPPAIPDPGVELSSPAAGSDTADTTPRFVATAAGAGASDTVTLRLYAGTSAAGSPLTTIALARAGDTWSGEPGAELDDGTYTAQAERVGAGKAVKSVAVTFRVDTTAPQLSLSTPGIGGSTSDSSPVFTGSAGSAAGDSLQVRAFVYSGLTDTGTPVGTFTGNRSGASFAFKAGSTLPVGTYTARAEQVDAAGNTGRSMARTFAVTSTAPASNLRDTMMADAPRAYWRLGEAGGSTAADQAAFANSGAYLGGLALGQAGVVPVAQSTAIALDGADDTVRVPSSASLNPTAALSLEAWIRPSALPSTTATLVRKDLQYLLRISSSGAVTFRLWHGGTSSELSTPAGAVTAGAWYHVVASFDGASMAIFVNGTVRATLAMSSPVDSSANVLTLGSANSSDWFRGRMDEVAVYGAALPGPRVQAHYDKASPVEEPAPTVVLESPAGGATVGQRPLFAGSATGEAPLVTVKVYGGSAATGTPVQTLAATLQSSGLFSVSPSTNLSAGTYTARAEQSTAAGLVGQSAPVTFTVQASSGETATIAAAGDIADCYGTDDEATANLLDAIPGTVMTLGDNAYTYGTAAEFQCFNSSWGRHKARIHPIPGDHDYGTPNAGSYFDYFGAAAGPRPSGFYSYDLGAWHIVALNSGCYVQERTCNAAEDEWLKNDLEQNSSQCVLAQEHEPRFSSGEIHGNVGSVEPLWQILYDHGADVVLSGSEHMYERFAPQTPKGAADPANGIRQFTVGTGGESHYQVGTIKPNSQVRESNTFGVLKMTLRPDGYDWQFVPVAGKTFTDGGSGSCH